MVQHCPTNTTMHQQPERDLCRWPQEGASESAGHAERREKARGAQRTCKQKLAAKNQATLRTEGRPTSAAFLLGGPATDRQRTYRPP